MKNAYLESQLYLNIGNVHFEYGFIKKAISNCIKGLTIAKNSKFLYIQAVGCLNLGFMYFTQTNFKKASKYTLKALDLANGSESTILVTAYINLGRIYYVNNPKLAYEYLQKSIQLVEIIHTRVIEDRYKVLLHDKYFDAYELIIPLCIRAKRHKKAFEYIERGKSRILTEIIGSRTVIKPTIRKPSKRFQSLVSIEQDCSRLLNNIGNPSNLRSPEIDSFKIDAWVTKLDNLYAEMQKEDPKYVYLRRGNPIMLRDLQKTIARYEKSLVVEYFFTNDSLIIVVISSFEYHLVEVTISREKLEGLLQSYLIGISEIIDIAEMCLDISNLLIKPINKFLKGFERIFFIPHGILHHFPLHTLLLNNEPIVQNYAVAYYPNASLIQYYDDKTSMTKLAAFGVGGNEFDDEAKDVADIYNTKPVLNATKRQVLSNLDNEILHFSCHGFFNIEDPLSSGIALFKCSKSGKSESKYDILSAMEIFNLRLPTTIFLAVVVNL
jgi:tetratricopeptide (TPR) repeat protein